MSLKLRNVVLGGAAVAAAVIVSCSQRSLVLVDVAASGGTPLSGTLFVKAGGEKVSFDDVTLSANSATPFRVGIYLPSGTSGKVTITGELDQGNCIIATGQVDTNAEPDVSSGKTTTAVLLPMKALDTPDCNPDAGSTGGATGTGGAPGTGGMGGSTGTGGMSGGTGGVKGTGGGPATGTGGSAPGTGGVKGTGGSTPGTGGMTGTGGVKGTGGVVGTGGITSTGGVVGTGGVTSTGGVVGTGGVTSTGGVTGTGGVVSTGGVTGSGGLTGTGGTRVCVCPAGETCVPGTTTCQPTSCGSGGITTLDENGQAIICPLGPTTE